MRIRYRLRLVRRRVHNFLVSLFDVAAPPDIDSGGGGFIFPDHRRPAPPKERRDAFAQGAIMAVRATLRAGFATGDARTSGNVIRAKVHLVEGGAFGHARAQGSGFAVTRAVVNGGRAGGSANVRGRILRPQRVIDAEEEAILLAS